MQFSDYPLEGARTPETQPFGALSPSSNFLCFCPGGPTVVTVQGRASGHTSQEVQRREHLNTGGRKPEPISCRPSGPSHLSLSQEDS